MRVTNRCIPSGGSRTRAHNPDPKPLARILQITNHHRYLKTIMKRQSDNYNKCFINIGKSKCWHFLMMMVRIVTPLVSFWSCCVLFWLIFKVHVRYKFVQIKYFGSNKVGHINILNFVLFGNNFHLSFRTEWVTDYYVLFRHWIAFCRCSRAIWIASERKAN